MKRNSFLISIILISLQLLSIDCFSNPDEIVLINKNRSWHGMIFSYWSPSSTVAIDYKKILNEHQSDTGKYIIQIPTQEPLFFDFSWNFKIQIVCLFPGDTLEFNTTESEFPFHFNGNRPSGELMFYTYLEEERLGVMSGNIDLEVTDRLDYQFVIEQAMERHRKKMELMNERDARNKFSKDGRRAIELSLYYRYLGELLFPYQAWKRIEDIAEKSFFVPVTYKSKLRELKEELAKDSLMYLLDYRRFILQYARFIMIESAGSQRIDLHSLLDFYKNAFQGKIRDCLLFDEVYLNFQRTGDASPILQVIDSVHNQRMHDELLSILKMSKKEFSENTLGYQLEDIVGEKTSLKSMLASNKNKLIYLDFWATWCAPCLMEMPDSKKLTEEFLEQDIEFIYLSVDADRQKWLKKVSTFSRSKNTHHYRIVNGTAFMKESGIPNVPRYILIGKNGEMITSNAPRPRSDEVRQLIRNYANQ